MFRIIVFLRVPIKTTVLPSHKRFRHIKSNPRHLLSTPTVVYGKKKNQIINTVCISFLLTRRFPSRPPSRTLVIGPQPWRLTDPTCTADGTVTTTIFSFSHFLVTCIPLVTRSYQQPGCAVVPRTLKQRNCNNPRKISWKPLINTARSRFPVTRRRRPLVDADDDDLSVFLPGRCS